MRKVLLVGLAVMLFATALVFAFHESLLRGCATLLIHENALEKAEAIFILSGGSYDRGNEAAKLFNAGYSQHLVCTGGNPYVELKVFNIDTLESDMCVANLKRLQVPDSCITQLKYGTSTREEFDTIIGYCKQQKLNKIIVLSSRLHTARVNSVFRTKMEEQGIEVILHGAPSSRFNEYLWWQSEDGLIAVNNEWLKTIYYWLKY
jgi:uncharacterized SAM-binding protein YcdF (DUF218 family)